MQINRQSLTKGVLSLAALSLMTGCVDDKYDLSDIDTTSRVTVNDLTVPVELDEIKLESVINLDDNENISTLVGEDGRKYYAIEKGGNIETSEFSIAGVHVDAPTINPTVISVNMPISGQLPIPEFELDPFDLPSSPLQSYEFAMNNVDKALKALKDVKTVNPMNVKVVLSIPQEFSSCTISFVDLKLQLPTGLITSNEQYNKTTGLITINELNVDQNGQAVFELSATGIEILDNNEVVNGYLGISGEVGVLSGQIKMTLRNVYIPQTFDIKADYFVNSFDIASFSGRINYEMDNIDIAPISLDGLPDFLDGPETEISIAEPQILVSLINPVGKYNLFGEGKIELVSNFKNGTSETHTSDTFHLIGEETKLAFCTPKNDYTTVEFNGLGNILKSDDANGLPNSISVNIKDIVFAGDVVDFPIGTNLGKADGDYSFSAPLGFGLGSTVVYEERVDGWNSEDLDNLYINKLHLTATCTTNLPVNVLLEVFPIDKNGNQIPVKENSGLNVPDNAVNEPIELLLQGANGPIKGLDGVIFRATVRQLSEDTDPLGPDLFLNLKEIRATVDGYFEKEF